MIKIDLMREIAQRLNVKEKEAQIIVDSLIDSIKETILEYGRLEIRNFGVFQVKERKARTGRNPKNKKEYPIPPHKAVTFKAGKGLKSL